MLQLGSLILWIVFMPQATLSMVQKKIQHLNHFKLEVEKQSLRYQLYHLEAHGELASEEHLQKYVQKKLPLILFSSLCRELNPGERLPHYNKCSVCQSLMLT